MQSKRPGCGEKFADFTRKGDTAKGPDESSGGGGKTDLITEWRPGQAECAGPALGQVGLLPVEVNGTDGPPVIAQQRMVNESKVIAARGEAEIADPAGGLIQHLANGIFQVALAAADVNDRQGVASGSPGGVLNIVEQIAGSVGADGKLGQRADVGKDIVGNPKAA